MHALEILHRDIKSANIFLYANNRVKLGDLNVSKINRGNLHNTQTGTPYYASPEIWWDQPQTGKSDIWSFGCVLFELMTFSPPFKAENMPGLYKKIIWGVLPSLDETGYSQELKNFACSMLKVNPKDRPEASELLKMQVITMLENDILPEYFKNFSTKGITKPTKEIHWKLFMPKDIVSINP